jgi:hypothetical protein
MLMGNIMYTDPRLMLEYELILINFRKLTESVSDSSCKAEVLVQLTNLRDKLDRILYLIEKEE